MQTCRWCTLPRCGPPCRSCNSSHEGPPEPEQRHSLVAAWRPVGGAVSGHGGTGEEGLGLAQRGAISRSHRLAASRATVGTSTGRLEPTPASHPLAPSWWVAGATTTSRGEEEGHGRSPSLCSDPNRTARRGKPCMVQGAGAGEGAGGRAGKRQRQHQRGWRRGGVANLT
jgi:hypothetical protein